MVVSLFSVSVELFSSSDDSLLAIAFSVLFFTGTVDGVLGYILLALGAIFLLTSFISFCPLYAPFKISTCKKK